MIGLRAPTSSDGWPDLRLAPAAVAAWLIAIGVLLIPGARGVMFVIVVAGVLALVTAVLARHPRSTVRDVAWPLALVGVAVAGVGGVAALRAASVRPPEVEGLVSARASGPVVLVISSDPAPLRGRWSTDRVRVPARLESVRAGGVVADVRTPVMVFAPGSWRDLLPGTKVGARARFGPTDYRAEAALLVVRGPPRVIAGPGRVQQAAGAVRAGLRGTVAHFPADARALVPGMVLGDTSAVSAELTADEQVAGLTHLTAVSGANVAVLLAAVLGCARLLGVRRRMLLVVGLLAVLAFVVVARPAPSLLRAAVMGCVALVGITRGVTGRGPAILAAGVLFLLAVDPWLALSMGFALSVVATGALLLAAPRWRDALATRMPARVAEPLAVATVAHLATAPLIVSLSGRVSLVAVVANLAAEPAVVVVTVCGALAAVVAPMLPGAAAVVAWPAGCGAWWVAQVAHHAAGLPFADIAWPASSTGVSTLLAITSVVLARGPTIVSRAWHASRDADRNASPDSSGPGDPRGRTGGPAGRARRGPGRHRRPSDRRGGRRS